MFAPDFLDFHPECSDPNCINNNEDSSYVCPTCQAAWKEHMNGLSDEDLYEFYNFNQQYLQDEEVTSEIVKQLGLDIESPSEYLQKINFEFFNHLFFTRNK
ncbi:MAG TPA: hypothetical protein VI911_00750 [Patescibacteria group bacterium]|nr:hypothetical protein [Patescibacteria group bacterium]